MRKPIKVAITGGICSGKSAVIKVFNAKGWRVFSLDDVAREFYGVPEVRNSLIEKFGKWVYLPDGSLNRRKLARVIFSDPEKLAMLDEIFLPRFFQFISSLDEVGCEDRLSEESLNELGESEIPSRVFIAVEGAVIGKQLPETLKHYDLSGLFDYFVFVDRPLKSRLECVMKKFSLSEEEALKRIKSQNLEEVKKKADFIIMNHFSIEELESVASFLADFLKHF